MADNSTPNTPKRGSKKKLNFDSPRTPKQVKLEAATVCTVYNVTEVVRTPSKFNVGKWYDRFEFAIVNDKSDQIQRVQCYKPEFREFLVNSKIIGDENKAIQVYGLQDGETDGHLKLTKESTFGDLVDLDEPFAIKHQNFHPIEDCKVKMDIGSVVSVEAKVMSYDVTHNKKCNIHKYELKNNAGNIEMMSYNHLDLKVGKSYQFFDYEIAEFQNIRQIKHTVSSRYKATKDVKVTKDNTSIIVTIRTLKSVNSSVKCDECDGVIKEEDIDDGLYTCPNAECAVTGFSVFMTFGMSLYLKFSVTLIYVRVFLIFPWGGDKYAKITENHAKMIEFRKNNKNCMKTKNSGHFVQGDFRSCGGKIF